MQIRIKIRLWLFISLSFFASVLPIQDSLNASNDINNFNQTTKDIILHLENSTENNIVKRDQYTELTTFYEDWRRYRYTWKAWIGNPFKYVQREPLGRALNILSAWTMEHYLTGLHDITLEYNFPNDPGSNSIRTDMDKLIFLTLRCKFDPSFSYSESKIGLEKGIDFLIRTLGNNGGRQSREYQISVSYMVGLMDYKKFLDIELHWFASPIYDYINGIDAIHGIPENVPNIVPEGGRPRFPPRFPPWVPESRSPELDRWDRWDRWAWRNPPVNPDDDVTSSDSDGDDGVYSDSDVEFYA